MFVDQFLACRKHSFHQHHNNKVELGYFLSLNQHRQVLEFVLVDQQFVVDY